MNTKKLLRKLFKRFPLSISRKYGDFSGHQIGKIKEDTKTVVLCLDFDEEVLSLMEKDNILDKTDLIITHHPFIYGTFKEVTSVDNNKLILATKILELNIPIYSFHTNFDEGKDGMNDALAEKLELEDVRALNLDPMARGGRLKNPMNIYDFAEYAKNKLNVTYGILLPYGKEMAEKVAIVGGGGWRSYMIAKNEDYDVFISGDIPHHGRRGVITNKYNYLDLPHEIERVFMYQFKKILLEIEPTLNIIIYDHEVLPEIV